jgi:NAD(P)-dependent dehydrogenase (short-subunit alcohol dehydrogenase family)
MLALAEKVALITGGSSGIGRATAMRLASHGMHIALASRNKQELDAVAQAISNGNRQAIPISTDVTDADACRRAVETTIDRLGRLDILLCSAGLSMRAPFAGADLTAMEQVVRVNFFGTLYMTHFALPHIVKARGSLVAISSLTGLRGIPTYAVYGASKFAIQGLYDALRLEMRPHGVHVGVVSPGFVDTPLRQHVLGSDGRVWETPPEPPFRIWPVEKCVDRIMHVILRRRKKALLPAFTGPLLTLDQALGGWLGDGILAWKLPIPSPGEKL